MAEISFVKLELALLAMEYADMGGGSATDEEVGVWARIWIRGLVTRNSEAHPFVARLLGEAEGFRRAEAERKRHAKEEREAAEAARRSAQKPGRADSEESTESPERAHRSDQSKATIRERDARASESEESLESADLLPEEPTADITNSSPTSNGTRPKTGTGETPKAEKHEKNVIPPTLEMVARYCKNRNNGIDPERFMAHYAARDWKVKGTRITNWQACVITWEKQQGEFAASGARGGRGAQVGPLV